MNANPMGITHYSATAAIMSNSASKDGSGKCIFKAIFTQCSSLYPQYGIFLGSAPKETNIADLSEILWRLLPTAETVVIFSRKTHYRAGNWSITRYT